MTFAVCQAATKGFPRLFWFTRNRCVRQGLLLLYHFSRPERGHVPQVQAVLERTRGRLVNEQPSKRRQRPGEAHARVHTHTPTHPPHSPLGHRPGGQWWERGLGSGWAPKPDN